MCLNLWQCDFTCRAHFSSEWNTVLKKEKKKGRKKKERKRKKGGGGGTHEKELPTQSAMISPHFFALNVYELISCTLWMYFFALLYLKYMCICSVSRISPSWARAGCKKTLCLLHCPRKIKFIHSFIHSEC